MSGRTTTKWLVAPALIAGGLVVVLAIQNRALRRAHAALAARTTQPYPGMFVPHIPATSVHGATVALGQPAAQAQVLYFFSPSCAFCTASTPRVNAIASALPAGVELVGVANGASDDVAAYATAQRFTFPIVAMRDQRTLALFRAAKVPLVMVIDRNGRVHHATLGALDRDEEVEAVLAAARTSSTTTNPPGAAR